MPSYGWLGSNESALRQWGAARGAQAERAISKRKKQAKRRGSKKQRKAEGAALRRLARGHRAH